MSRSIGNGGREGWCLGNAARTVKPELYAMVCSTPGPISLEKDYWSDTGEKT